MRASTFTRGAQLCGTTLFYGANLAICLASSPQSAYAATEAAPAAKSGLEEVVVTAARREEKLQDVPISVTALSPDALQAASINAVTQLGQVTPGLQFTRNSTAAQFSIRGVTARATYPGDESNIAIYVDGVYQSSSNANAFDLLEIDRIEVLRGPQGTLFGRNATGGLINVITPDPSFTPRAHVDAQFGNYNTTQLRGYATSPLTDTLAFDIALNYYNDDGFVKELVDNIGKVGDRLSKTARSKLMFKPSDTTKIVLTLGYTEGEDSSALAYQPINRNTRGVAVPNAIIPDSPNEVALSFDPSNKLRQKDASLRTSFDLGGVGLETTTAYQDNTSHNITDNDASTLSAPSPFAQPIDSHQQDKSASQEVRFLANPSDAIQWTAGVFAFYNEGRYDPLSISAPLIEQRAKTHTKSAAGFAQATFPLSDALNLTVGGRYSWEARDLEYTYRQGAVTAQSPSPKPDTSYNDFTPHVSLQYVFTPNLNVYASYSRGSKSGLYNTVGSLNPAIANTAIDPEKLDAYEIGLKTDLTDRLRFNTSVYYYDYKDIQLTQRSPTGASFLTNAGAATMYGGEAEFTYVPIDDLNIRLGLSYLHTELDEFKNGVATIPNAPTVGGNTNQTVADLAGNRLIRSPRFTLTLGADYSWQTGVGLVGVSGNIFRSDKVYFTYANTDSPDPRYNVLDQPAYTLINAQAWIEPTEALRLGIYCENLTDQKVRNNMLDTTAATFEMYQRPRTYGVRASMKF